MRYWLMKSDPYEFHIDDFAALPNQTIAWEGVRNYQARNFMRHQMAVDDQVLFYHSCCKDPGIVGIASVSAAAYPDESQFNPNGKYFDAKVSRENPRWFNVNITLLQRPRLVTIRELRQHRELQRMRVLQIGNRLSITPVDPAEWQFIMTLL